MAASDGQWPARPVHGLKKLHQGMGFNTAGLHHGHALQNLRRRSLADDLAVSHEPNEIRIDGCLRFMIDDEERPSFLPEDGRRWKGLLPGPLGQGRWWVHP